jgi:hypothetical protein
MVPFHVNRVSMEVVEVTYLKSRCVWILYNYEKTVSLQTMQDASWRNFGVKSLIRARRHDTYEVACVRRSLADISAQVTLQITKSGG